MVSKNILQISKRQIKILSFGDTSNNLSFIWAGKCLQITSNKVYPKLYIWKRLETSNYKSVSFASNSKNNWMQNAWPHHKIFNTNEKITSNANLVALGFLWKTKVYPGPCQTFKIDLICKYRYYNVTIFRNVTNVVKRIHYNFHSLHCYTWAFC